MTPGHLFAAAVRLLTAAVAAAALGGCANDPYALRDYAAVINQAGKVGAAPPGTTPSAQGEKANGAREIEHGKTPRDM